MSAPRARRIYGLWLGGAALVVGLSLLAGAGALFVDDWRFAHEARATRGTVVAKRTWSTRRPRRTRTWHYEVTYRFEANGTTYEARGELPRAAWELLSEQGPVDVLYRPGEPTASRLAGRRAWRGEAVLALVGVLFALAGSFTVARTMRATRRERRLRQKGVRVAGSVVELRERNVEVDGVHWWRLGYEYPDFQGRLRRATVDVTAEEAGTWKVGDGGTVLYDPESPDESVWLGRETER